ncbi:hypothetical protein G9C98_003039 [Cotesia typhae]|uniref:Peptidase M12B domain-containing protein n=1 Tax=Cotesia typhae TaxID=2053667 RepID=A0A8J5V7U2_9HYME|nr:hypothetical protein G9C98_003039 [Cotesia typhae]
MGVINFPRRHKRSLEDISLRLTAYGRVMDLNLKLLSNTLYSEDTPVYKIFKNGYQQPGTMAQDIEQSAAYQRTIYEDPDHFASLIVDTFPDGTSIIRVKFSANIGSVNLTIFPASVQYLQQSPSMYINGYAQPNQYIYYRTNNLMTVYNDVVLPWNLPRPAQVQNNRVVVPDTLYIEVLVIVDYPLLEAKGMDNIINYLLAFWNQVDLMFRRLDRPLYKINIAGIVLPLDNEVLEYFYKDPIEGWVYRTLKYRDYLSFSAKWLYKEQQNWPFDSYDIAVTLTSREDPIKWTPQGYKSSAGISYLGQVCQVNHYSRSIEKIAVINDNGFFSGVPVAVHEIGHLIGAQHDNRYPCSDADGYLMSSVLRSTSNRFKWSPCSLNDFKSFLSSDPRCLYNRPKNMKL